MRTPRELTETNSMKELTDELEALNIDQEAIRRAYARGVQLDPDHIELERRRQLALYYMRVRACFHE